MVQLTKIKPLTIVTDVIDVKARSLNLYILKIRNFDTLDFIYYRVIDGICLKAMQLVTLSQRHNR